MDYFLLIPLVLSLWAFSVVIQTIVFYSYRWRQFIFKLIFQRGASPQVPLFLVNLEWKTKTLENQEHEQEKELVKISTKKLSIFRYVIEHDWQGVSHMFITAAHFSVAHAIHDYLLTGKLKHAFTLLLKVSFDCLLSSPHRQLKFMMILLMHWNTNRILCTAWHKLLHI